MTHLPKARKRKRRVAGYARVSTDSDEQFTSYQSQVNYHTKMIEANPGWEFVRVYADEGISGTGTKNHVGFNTMIKDAMAGRIDLIVTKLVSRFVRNIVDSITTIRRLKEKDVERFFKKENIYTLDSKGKLLITIMSSLD
ncbi:MAG: recombinase family protein [Bacilli bacterium]|nr:recombinase family protein [Bacilli bacterium]